MKSWYIHKIDCAAYVEKSSKNFAFAKLGNIREYIVGPPMRNLPY